MRKQYINPSTTLVSIQFSSICKISSIGGGDLGFGKESDGTIEPY